MLRNKKLNPVVTEFFVTGRKLYISLVFITQTYFAVPKNIRPNSYNCFVIKIPSKPHLPQIFHQILIFKTLGIFTKNVLKNRLHL